MEMLLVGLRAGNPCSSQPRALVCFLQIRLVRRPLRGKATPACKKELQDMQHFVECDRIASGQNDKSRNNEGAKQAEPCHRFRRTHYATFIHSLPDIRLAGP